jgi:hypothetical protein
MNDNLKILKMRMTKLFKDFLQISSNKRKTKQPLQLPRVRKVFIISKKAKVNELRKNCRTIVNCNRHSITRLSLNFTRTVCLRKRLRSLELERISSVPFTMQVRYLIEVVQIFKV